MYLFSRQEVIPYEKVYYYTLYIVLFLMRRYTIILCTLCKLHNTSGISECCSHILGNKTGKGVT